MDSMDFNDVGIEDVGVAVLQELWNRVAIQAIDLGSETRDLVLEKGSFQEFSRSLSQLSTLLRALDLKKIEAGMGTDLTKAKVQTLSGQLKKAQKIIGDYKSGSRLRLVLQSHSILMQMQDLAKQIAATICSFEMVNLNMSLNIKALTDNVINSLEAMEFRSAAETETIASEIQNSISQNSRNRENAVILLEKIAEAVGANANVSMVQNELALLKEEKEDMENQKRHAEALQLDQLIQLLYSTEIVTSQQNMDNAAYHQQFPITSFICPLCNEMMVDPVAVCCGHSFERKAIQEHFSKGENNCPTCGEKLPSPELTPNVNLRSSIEEWKQRDNDLKFQAAVSGINSNDHVRQNKALEDMETILEMHQCANKVLETGITTKLVLFLKEDGLNTKATLRCLYFLAKQYDNHKDAMVEAGVVRRIVKQIYKADKVPDAIALLLELSKRETLEEQIGKSKDCIPLLVSLLNSDISDLSQNAQMILENLSSNTSFVVKMAEAGYFQPFVARFNEGPQESRALLASDLIKMQLKENNIRELKDRDFVHNLVQMLNSNSPAYKMSCLKCIKVLIPYQKMVKRLLSDPTTVPLLLGLISFATDAHLKQKAGEILALLIGSCQHSEFEMYQGPQELQSKHNISLFLQLVASSDAQTKIHFLHLLVELSFKSEIARDIIRSDGDAIAQLFSSINGDQPLVRRWMMKLIHSISDGHPDGVPLPPIPQKEIAINSIVAIFIHSVDSEERSIAAGIISQLPNEDIAVDEILKKSEALKAIREVICSDEEEHNGIRAPVPGHTSLLENSLSALLRFTEPTKPELQRQVGKLELYPSLVRVLSRGSSLAKERTATALAQLSLSTNLSLSTITSRQARSSMPLFHMMNRFPNMSWCCTATSENESLCAVHGAACSPRQTFCLVKVDAVKPLVQTLRETESGVAEAALMALETLLADHNTLSPATAAIVDNQGVVAILQVLEKGSLSAKAKALELFQIIMKQTTISDPLFQRSERILIQLLNEGSLKKQAALVLKQMKIIPDQSSYF